jgi:hypothetical protein
MMSLQTFSRRTRRAVVIGGAALAIAAPGASAQATRCPAPPPSSIAAPASEGYTTWRAACASDGTALTESERFANPRAAYAINDRALPPDPKPVATEAPAGFDWASAAIGATIAGGSLLLLGAAVRLRQHTAAGTA